MNTDCCNSEETGMEEIVEYKQNLPVTEFVESLGPITPENAEMLVSVLSSYVQLWDSMEEIGEKMEILEEEHNWMKEEIMILKHKTEVVDDKDPAPTLTISSEIWKLFVKAWNDYMKPAHSAMDPGLLANKVITHATTKATTTFHELWESQACVIVFLRRFG